MGSADAIRAIRLGVASAEMDHVVAVRLSGAGATAALDAVCPIDLRFGEGRARRTLLLDRDARPFADLLVGRDGESWLLLAEGPSAGDLVAHLRGHAVGELTVDDLSIDHRIFSITGPFSWELMAAVVGPEVVNLPRDHFFRFADATCFRAGKTGEHTFDLLVPRSSPAKLQERLVEAGAAFDLVQADLAALDQCALESWFFNIRREGRAALTPLELQLQWRVSSRKEFLGAQALRNRRRDGIARRIVGVASPHPLADGEPVSLGDQSIGTILHAGLSTVRGDFVAIALIDLRYAHSGIARYTVGGDGERRAIATLSPPFIDSRSRHVRPDRHSYRTRAESDFPPLHQQEPRRGD